MGMCTGLLAGAMTGVGQSFNPDFSWNLIWIIGGSVGGSTLAVCTLGGAALGGAIGYWKGPELWQNFKHCVTRQKEPLSYSEMIKQLGWGNLSKETHQWLERIYNELIKDLAEEEV